MSLPDLVDSYADANAEAAITEHIGITAPPTAEDPSECREALLSEAKKHATRIRSITGFWDTESAIKLREIADWLDPPPAPAPEPPPTFACSTCSGRHPASEAGYERKRQNIYGSIECYIVGPRVSK